MERLRVVEPCEFVPNPIFSPMIEDNPKIREESWAPRASTPTRRHAHRVAHHQHRSPGRPALPCRVDGGQAIDGTFGDYPARIEQAKNSCSIAVETDDGQVVGVSYSHNITRAVSVELTRINPLVEQGTGDSLWTAGQDGSRAPGWGPV